MKCMLCGKKMNIPHWFDNALGLFCKECARKVFRAYWEEYWRKR